MSSSHSRTTKNHWRAIFISLLFLGDGIAIGLSLLITASLTPNKHHFGFAFFPNHYNFSAFLPLTFYCFALLLGLYRRSYHVSLKRQHLTAIKVYLASIIVITSVLYFFKSHLDVRDVLFRLFIIAPILFYLVREILYQLNLKLQQKGFGLIHALFVGFDGSVHSVLERFQNFPELGYDVQELERESQKEETIPSIQFQREAVEKVIREKHIEQVFVPTENIVFDKYNELLEICQRTNINLKVLSPESDILLSKAKVYDIAGIPLNTDISDEQKKRKEKVKRIFDIIVSMLGLILLSPILFFISVIIKLESHGSIFFKQRRSLAAGEKEFDFIKFRSMKANADEQKNNFRKHNETDGALFKIRDDPRRTAAGKFLRRHSLDELPQLINVLKGEMSIVGPRPLPVEDYVHLSKEENLGGYYIHRAEGKPGITGLWQISGRSDLGFKEMVLLDLYYLENQSFLFDLEIIFATIPVVLFGRGAY